MAGGREEGAGGGGKCQKLWVGHEEKARVNLLQGGEASVSPKRPPWRLRSLVAIGPSCFSRRGWGSAGARL